MELPVRREGDINRHRYRDAADLSRVIRTAKVDLVDIHEEPFSLAARQCLVVSPPGSPTVMYTAQNIDRRFPPPFAQFEHAAFGRVKALYPCSAQAASVARGKGFRGMIEVLPLGFDETVFRPGDQSGHDEEFVLGFFGRLVPEKGATEAVRIFASLSSRHAVRLIIVGSGPHLSRTLQLARELGVRERVEVHPWQAGENLAAMYRRCHVVLLPSEPTYTWTEQFGRVIVEAQASGAAVAGFATGAIPEVAGEAAHLAEVGDIEGLVEGLDALLADPEEFASRRDAGLMLSRKRTWSRVAERQARLYEAALSSGLSRVPQPRSPAARRVLAQLEFGPPALAASGARPFALPVLRRGGVLASAMARAIDGASETAALLVSTLSRRGTRTTY